MYKNCVTFETITFPDGWPQTTCVLTRGVNLHTWHSLTQLRKLNTFPFVHFKPARTMTRHSGERTGNRPKWKTGNAWSVNDCCYCFQCRYAHALSCLVFSYMGCFVTSDSMCNFVCVIYRCRRCVVEKVGYTQCVLVSCQKRSFLLPRYLSVYTNWKGPIIKNKL